MDFSRIFSYILFILLIYWIGSNIFNENFDLISEKKLERKTLKMNKNLKNYLKYSNSLFSNQEYLQNTWFLSFSQPSINPTSIPSSIPTNYPTTRMPTITLPPHLLKPVFQPTSFSSNNHEVPSTMPTQIPSSLPSKTIFPSSIPSSLPSSLPSANPTGLENTPTAIPSLIPTNRPSSYPTIPNTLIPTSGLISFTFIGKSTLSNVNASSLNARALSEFKNNTSNFMKGISQSDVNIISVQMLNLQRRLRTTDADMYQFNQLINMLVGSKLNNFIIIWNITIIPSILGYSTENQAFLNLTSQLNSSIANGDFDRRLSLLNLIFNGTKTVNNYYILSPSPTTSPTSSIISRHQNVIISALSRYRILIGVLGSFIFIILPALIYFYLKYQSRKGKQREELEKTLELSNRKLLKKFPSLDPNRGNLPQKRSFHKVLSKQLLSAEEKPENERSIVDFNPNDKDLILGNSNYIDQEGKDDEISSFFSSQDKTNDPYLNTKQDTMSSDGRSLKLREEEDSILLGSEIIPSVHSSTSNTSNTSNNIEIMKKKIVELEKLNNSLRIRSNLSTREKLTNLSAILSKKNEIPQSYIKKINSYTSALEKENKKLSQRLEENDLLDKISKHELKKYDSQYIQQTNNKNPKDIYLDFDNIYPEKLLDFETINIKRSPLKSNISMKDDSKFSSIKDKYLKKMPSISRNDSSGELRSSPLKENPVILFDGEDSDNKRFLGTHSHENQNLTTSSSKSDSKSPPKPYNPVKLSELPKSNSHFGKNFFDFK